MMITTQALVITTIKYGDSSLIVKCLTASHGLKSYLLKGILTARKKTWNHALFQPLTQLDLVATHKNQGGLEYIREAKVSYPYKTLHSDLKKNAIALFLSEMLHNSLHEEEENLSLFSYLQQALQWLDTHEEIANFHILFLLHLTKYLGCSPDNTHPKYPLFDLQEGKFVLFATTSPVLEGEECFAFSTFLGMKFDALSSVKITKEMRQKLLQAIVMYFQLHVHGFKKPRSLPILHELFSEI